MQNLDGSDAEVETVAVEEPKIDVGEKVYAIGTQYLGSNSFDYSAFNGNVSLTV